MILRFNADGTVSGVYDDRVRSLLPGDLSVQRASVVTFDNARQTWQAREVGSEDVIAEDPLRNVCVQLERQVLEARL